MVGGRVQVSEVEAGSAWCTLPFGSVGVFAQLPVMNVDFATVAANDFQPCFSVLEARAVQIFPPVGE